MFPAGDCAFVGAYADKAVSELNVGGELIRGLQGQQFPQNCGLQWDCPRMISPWSSWKMLVNRFTSLMRVSPATGTLTLPRSPVEDGHLQTQQKRVENQFSGRTFQQMGFVSKSLRWFFSSTGWVARWANGLQQRSTWRMPRGELQGDPMGTLITLVPKSDTLNIWGWTTSNFQSWKFGISGYGGVLTTQDDQNIFHEVLRKSDFQTQETSGAPIGTILHRHLVPIGFIQDGWQGVSVLNKIVLSLGLWLPQWLWRPSKEVPSLLRFCAAFACPEKAPARACRVRPKFNGFGAGSAFFFFASILGTWWEQNMSADGVHVETFFFQQCSTFRAQVCLFWLHSTSGTCLLPCKNSFLGYKKLDQHPCIYCRFIFYHLFSYC